MRALNSIEISHVSGAFDEASNQMIGLMLFREALRDPYLASSLAAAAVIQVTLLPLSAIVYSFCTAGIIGCSASMYMNSDQYKN